MITATLRDPHWHCLNDKLISWIPSGQSYPWSLPFHNLASKKPNWQPCTAPLFFTPISHYAIVFSFALRFTELVGSLSAKAFCGASASEVSGMTFSDSDTALVPKFLNPDPGPVTLQIWESDSCSDSGCNYRSNRNLPMLLPEKWPHRLLLLLKWKSDHGSGPVFHKFLTPGLDPDPKKRRILPESKPALRIRSHLWSACDCWLSSVAWWLSSKPATSYHEKLLDSPKNIPQIFS